MAASHLQCRECKSEYPLEALYVCERCFGPLEVAYGRAQVELSVAERRRRIQAGPQNIWRYADFLPAAAPPGPSGRLNSRAGLPAGCTPLIRADRLAARLGLKEVWVKNDAANPTHSFKDRVVSVATTRARELGFETIACASTGNLANSVAAHGAALGMDSYVFIPSDLEEQKVLATGVYGTKLVGVKGNYDDVNRLCTELCAERDWAFVNINLRPYYAEGSKTLAFEIAEQLGWELPDRCVVPVASGSLFTKIAKGFEEWREIGLLDGELPAMNGAQAEGCSPVASAFAAGHEVCRARSPSLWRSATRPTVPTRSTSHAAPAARWMPSATMRSAPGSGCSPRRRACSPRRPEASRRRCWRSSPSAVRSIPRSGSCWSSPARG